MFCTPKNSHLMANWNWSYLSDFLRWGLMCYILRVIFGLLFPSLWLSFVTKRFGRYILRPSSGVLCLSGYGSGSTWEISRTSSLKMIPQVQSFPYWNKRGTPEKGRRIQGSKRCVTTNDNKCEDNSPENKTQNIRIDITLFSHSEISVRAIKLKCSSIKFTVTYNSSLITVLYWR